MKLSDLTNYQVVGTGNALLPKLEPKKKKSAGQKVLDAGTSVANFFGAKGISEQFGADLARLTVPKEQKQFVSYPTMREVVGSAIQTGANFIPGVGKGAGMVAKTAVGGATGYAFDVGSKLQKGESAQDVATPGIGTAVGAGLPVVGAALRPAFRLVGRLFKGLGSGLSGVSSKTIDAIVDNPRQAQVVSDQLARSGNSHVLEENAREIINGVSTVRQQARKAFGEGLEQLSETDIDPSVFREQTQRVLDRFGVSKKGTERTFSNVEFDDPKNTAKALELVDRLSNVDLDGRSLRKLSDDIQSATYKVATSDERLSFNAFLNELSDALKAAITKSTGKLDEINAAFSRDMQLVESVESIFGKVNFRSLPEVVRASQKLETLFAQRGLAPEIVDDFLKRIGANPEDFRASEAVRQISDKATGVNAKGLSLGELTQQVTSAVVTPKTVKRLSIITGISREKLLPLLRQMKTPARNILINALLQGDNSTGRPQN